MPAAVAENSNEADRAEQMRNVLKVHIMRERARKKQEREQEVEEERLRKEREAREQQDEMTLGETREQISQIESKLTQLKEEKHQLFLQLKKVLNEDDNRRRQLVKENRIDYCSEMIAIQGIPAGFAHQPLYIGQSVPPRAAPTSQIQPSYKPSAKRTRSPSPQPLQVSMYHQRIGYKPVGGNVGTSYQGSPQKDDGRRNELVRAVLWNKPQYSNQPSAFYPVPPPPELSIFYPSMPQREPTRSVYDYPPRPQARVEQKLKDHPPESYILANHAAMPINASKSGSITAGYPVRSQTQYQQAPPPASLYTAAQSRPIYPSPGPPINYTPRE